MPESVNIAGIFATTNNIVIETNILTTFLVDLSCPVLVFCTDLLMPRDGLVLFAMFSFGASVGFSASLLLIDVDDVGSEGVASVLVVIVTGNLLLYQQE